MPAQELPAPIPPSQVVEKHSQKEGMSCAASAIEVILKCHGRLALDDFSIQAKYGNTNIGFGAEDEYRNRDIDPSNRSKPIREALEDIAAELRDGRFPAVSL